MSEDNIKTFWGRVDLERVNGNEIKMTVMLDPNGSRKIAEWHFSSYVGELVVKDANGDMIPWGG